MGAEDGDRRRLWCSFSRTKEARANGAHAAWVRRTVRHLLPAAEERLETDYPSGTCWIGMAKIASAREQPGEGAREGVRHADKDPGHGPPRAAGSEALTRDGSAHADGDGFVSHYLELGRCQDNAPGPWPRRGGEGIGL